MATPRSKKAKKSGERTKQIKAATKTARRKNPKPTQKHTLDDFQDKLDFLTAPNRKARTKASKKLKDTESKKKHDRAAKTEAVRKRSAAKSTVKRLKKKK